MIALFGSPSPELISRYHSMRGYKWPYAIHSEDGTVCTSVEQDSRGSFFDDGITFSLPKGSCVDSPLIYHRQVPVSRLDTQTKPQGHTSLPGREGERFPVIFADDGCFAAGGEEDSQ